MDIKKLIPELSNWSSSSGEDFTVETWIEIEGNVRFAIAYSFLFWPEFYEYEDCIFFKRRFRKKNYEDWKNSGVENYAQIEAVLNHTHILDLFTLEKQAEVTYEQILFLGNKLCEIYNVKLKHEFPEKLFIVDFNGKAILNELDEYEITFYQVKNNDRKTK